MLHFRVLKLISILLVAMFAAIGSGAAGYLHEQQHHLHSPTSSARINVQTADEDHDEATCTLCALLHMPALSGDFAAVQFCLGALIALSIPVLMALASQHAPLFVVCRGPPVL